MKYILTIIIFMLTGREAPAQKLQIVKHASQADFKVFITKVEHEADLKVFKVGYPILAEGNKGKWFFGNSTQADKKIVFVYYPSQADLKIYYVNYKNLAGWVNQSKKYLLDK